MYDVIVIGAGNGGMTGALNLAKAGKKVLLLERHIVPGGAGTTFRRGRFEFDAGLHTLWGIGTKENPQRLGKVFKELGILDKLEFVQQHELYNLNLSNIVSLTMPNTSDAFVKKAQLLSLSPKQAKGVKEYQKLVRGLAKEFFQLYEDLDGEVSEKTYPLLFKYGTRDTLDVMGEFFTAPLPKLLYGMNAGYAGFNFDLVGMPFLFNAFLYELDGACHVKGGAQSISNALMDEFEKYGGKVLYNAEVDHINTKDGRVTGVRLLDGREFEAEHILCNVNKVRAYVDYLDDDVVGEEMFQQLKLSKPAFSMVAIYLGLNCTAEELGVKHGISYFMDLKSPARGKLKDTPLAEQYGNAMYVSCYNLDDPDYSAPGTCVLSCLTSGFYEDWENLSPEEYVRAKEKVTERGLEMLYHFYPTLKDHIEVLESSTPMTHQRYLGSIGGSIYSSYGSMEEFLTNKLDATSPVKGLYFCGASIIAGGFNTTYMSGKAVSDMMLRHW